MSTRILHCSTAVENYYICVEHQVAGLSHRGPQPDDLVYLGVRVGKKTLCGARIKLHEITNRKPWPDGKRYVHALSVLYVEFCQPFDMAVLSERGGKYWSMMYVQSSKFIRDKAAGDLLDQTFSANKASISYLLKLLHLYLSKTYSQLQLPLMERWTTHRLCQTR